MFRRSDSRTRDDGFTLIELLVVVAIIAILTAIVTVGVMGALKDSRDKKRIAGLEQVKLALEVYRNAHGSYPVRGTSLASGGCAATVPSKWSGHGTSYGDCSEYIVGLGNILTLPVDPNNDQYGYIYQSNGSAFKLLAYRVVESESVDSRNHPYVRYPNGCSEEISGYVLNTYSVYGGEAAKCW